MWQSLGKPQVLYKHKHNVLSIFRVRKKAGYCSRFKYLPPSPGAEEMQRGTRLVSYSQNCSKAFRFSKTISTS